MEGDRLVSRRTDNSDRRRTLVRITAQGRALILAHRERNAEIFGRLEAQFGRDRLARLLDLLEELRQLRL
jgi:DNA-binding MarR family transcriptional regulator